MRPQQNRRIRGRGNNNNNSNRNRVSNPLTRNYESNGPDVKIRGNAQHIADKYTALARDAQAAGDRIIAENYLQHAEHYMRIILSAQPQVVQTLRDEGTYDHEANTNVVDLPVVIADTGEIPIEATSQLDMAEEESTVPHDATAATTANDEPVQEQPAVDKPRRITRRRLPRQIAAAPEQDISLPDKIDADTDSAGDAHHNSSPIKRVRIVKPVIAVVDKAASSSSDEAGQVNTTGDEPVAIEKPRRRRRVLKGEVVQAS